MCIIGIKCELTEPIQISQGQVIGSTNLYGDEFLGIKYGECPKRFAPVDDVQPWTQTFYAITPAPGCMQNCTSFPSACPTNCSECCFTLNIYRPLQTPGNANLPVMVHFNGGSFTVGAAGVQLLNASRLVGLNQGVIVITCNYRLQAFGFYFSDNITDSRAPGNVALLDQQKCLEWIQKNVIYFGGDPSNVTIWGQSAGASSVGFHMQQQFLKYNQFKLFNRVIFQSWPAGIQPRSLEQSKAYNRQFAELCGCYPSLDVIACLRNKNYTDILKCSSLIKYDIPTYLNKPLTVGLPWDATLNLPSYYLQYGNVDFINRYASQINIPVIWGIDKDEGTLFIDEAVNKSVPLNYLIAKGIVGFLWYPQNVGKISKLYNITNPFKKDYHDIIAQILADYAFTCPMRNMSRSLTLAGNTNIYSYVFDYIIQAVELLYGSSHWAPDCYTHVCHKSEMPFVFNPPNVPTIQFTDEEETFAQSIGCRWTNFGKTGNPNSLSCTSPTWNAFTINTNTSLYLTLDTTGYVSNYRGNPFCDFWDNLGYTF
ncbi:unnamed protein product [Adineta steineri]|uniref:Carboxylic ester hydrolase n=1 Tax=Adineta steineri TaxID=433720 RepID=A0A818I3L6_9BILA|nr:unnamed protein product [Adineta steineri]CAF3513632.1 unnamed protein product [Adineta steineri]